jgi:hypothetical protein
MVSDLKIFAGEKKKERVWVSFYIGENNFEKKTEQSLFPSDKYPIYISIDYRDEAVYESLKNTLNHLPKDTARYRHENYYGKRFDIFVADTEGVRAVLNDKVLKEAGKLSVTMMANDEQIFPHQIMDKARSISLFHLNRNTPQMTR